MDSQLPSTGAANEDLSRKIHAWWLEAAAKAGVDLNGFDGAAPLAVRLAWALSSALLIALAYVRFSSKLQSSDEDQLRANVVYAAQNGMYVPPEFVCVDRAVSGRRLRREGIERLKLILKQRLATVLLTFTLSRLYRRSCDAYKFVQEEVVEAGLRAIAVAQSIDTADERSWKLKFQVHSMVDEMLLEAIADHCREGLRGLHLKGWVTGALGVGYRPKVIADGPLTKRGLPRTMPEVDPTVAELIRKHALLHLDGMKLKEGRRRWLAAGGPCDPRSTTGRMSPSAYRRLWSNIRLTGRWEFGRMKNKFLSKQDYVSQTEQPDKEVAVFQCEELRILDDSVFLALQQWLSTLEKGPRGPRQPKTLQLWDLTTEMFLCAVCSQPDAPIRYYQTGAHGLGMSCKNGDLCPCNSAVRRKEAVIAVCRELAALLQRDGALIEDVICRSVEIDARGDDGLREELAQTERKLANLGRRLEDLFELAGQGSDSDRQEVMSRIRATQAERAGAQLQALNIQRTLDASSSQLTTEQVRSIVSQMSSLLEDAAAGILGEDAVYKALAVFRRLTGGCIWVHVERRPKRKQTNVRGVFQPHLVHGVVEDGGNQNGGPHPPGACVSVWLREPPRKDKLAIRAHQLIDLEGHSFRSAAKVFQSEGYTNVTSASVYQFYERYYEMVDEPMPKRPYNNGRKRRSE